MVTLACSDLRRLIETVAPAISSSPVTDREIALGRISMLFTKGVLRAQATDRYVILRNQVSAWDTEGEGDLHLALPSDRIKPLIAALRKGNVVCLSAEGEEVIVEIDGEEAERLSAEGASDLWEAISRITYRPSNQSTGQSVAVIPLDRLSIVLAAAKKVSTKGSLVQSLPGYIRRALRFTHSESEHWEAIAMPDLGPQSAV